MRLLSLSLLGLFAASQAYAAETTAQTGTSVSSQMSQLLADGYEIKAAVQNGKTFVVFLQKDSTAYACEMANLSQSQCGKIN